MHRDIKRALQRARGESAFVVAANVDIRGFSAFSQRVESVEAAVYLRRVYSRILDDYYPNASFFKLTGDGLLLVFVYQDDDGLKSLADDVLRASFRLLEDFADLTSADPMVNFRVPENVGIGIARGAASRIFAGRKTLDYSGRVLNLASRLMNLARPTGIVLDAAFDATLLASDIRSRFADDEVFLAGIAESAPMAILFTASLTDLPYSSKQPIGKLHWVKTQTSWTYKDLQALTTHYRMHLGVAPVDDTKILVEMTYPKIVGRRAAKGQELVSEFSDLQDRWPGALPTLEHRRSSKPTGFRRPPENRRRDGDSSVPRPCPGYLDAANQGHHRPRPEIGGELLHGTSDGWRARRSSVLVLRNSGVIRRVRRCTSV